MKQKNVILLIVAVGCGIVAAFLTAQMRAGGTVEQVEVLVAAKDLPVGTTLSREDLKDEKFVKVKKLPKDSLPPAFVVDKELLVDKRLARPLRAEETFNPQDLLKGGAITLPPNHNMVSLPVGVGQAAAGFVGPGSRVDVIATLRLAKRLDSFVLLKNMLVVAVNTQTTYQNNNESNGAFPNLSMVSFAVHSARKEAQLLALAKTRGCSLELILRHPESSDTNEINSEKDIEDNIKLLSDDGNEVAKAIGPNGNNGKDEKRPDGNPAPSNPAPSNPVKPGPSYAPPPTIAVVEVLVAKRDIEPNTQVTNDLIKEAFEWREVPKDFASEALVRSNYAEALGQALKKGVSKNQWVTWTMVGLQTPKDVPREFFDPKTKPGDTDPVAPKPIQKKIHDITVTTSSGSTVHRYEEIAPGRWRKIGEMTPEQAAKSPPESAPQANPDARKID